MLPFQDGCKAARIAALRRRIERFGSHSVAGTAPNPLSLGLEEMPGIAGDALHEVIAATRDDRAAAFGFLLALLGRALAARSGPALLIAARGVFAGSGAPYGHGLGQLGVDVARLLLVETRGNREALWAMEESLRAPAGAAVIAGALEGELDLTASRRLSLAAGDAGTPLLLLRSALVRGTSTAATRWRVAAASSAADRFGALESWRWNAALERCRNGRPGHWLLEWNHAAHRLRMAQVLADRPLPQSAGSFSLAV